MTSALEILTGLATQTPGTAAQALPPPKATNTQGAPLPPMTPQKAVSRVPAMSAGNMAAMAKMVQQMAPAAAPVRAPSLKGVESMIRNSGLMDPQIRQPIDGRYSQYDEPDFLARPPDEAAMESFLFSEMQRLGNKTPNAILKQWTKIQDLKAARPMARAQHFAGLIRDRHRSDLARSLQADQIDAANTRSAIGALADVMFKQADLNMRAAATNRQMGLHTGALRGQLAKQFTTTFEPKPITKEVGEARDNIINTTQAISGLNRFAQLARNEAGGWGVISDVAAYGRRAFNMGQSREFSRLRQQMVADLIRAMNNARVADSNTERKGLMDTIPSAADDFDTVQKWAQRGIEFMHKLRRNAVDQVDSHVPGLGTNTVRGLGTLLQDEQKALMLLNQQTQRRNAQQMQHLMDESQRYFAP